MTFTEFPFWVLTAVTFGLWRVCRNDYRAKSAVLLGASVVFYGYRHWPLLFLLFLYCFIDWWAACWIARSKKPMRPLAIGVTFNLVVLAYWKYAPLFLTTLADLAPLLHLPAIPPPPNDWVIPFGISFYAFTGIAYMVDVYRRVTPVETSFWRYTLSAMFFPHLVAGPILRPNEFLEKLRPDAMPSRIEAPLEALHLVALGLFKKMVLADRIALAIDPFFSHVGGVETAGVWALPYVYLYALQIYFDFAGYTDIARGLGLLFGFRWPENFNSPYLAASIKDFWRRWHMTLSRFLKDYLYVPLGGNRCSPGRMRVNLLLTMLLGGLWHGASWSFMVWGGLHGVYLVLHDLWTRTAVAGRLRRMHGVVGALWKLLCILLTFHAVCLAWCFFRLTAFPDSIACVRKWLVFDADKMLVGGAADPSLWLLLVGYGVMTVFGSAAIRCVPDLKPAGASWRHAPLARGFSWGFGSACLLLALVLSPGGEKPPFIYFQF